MFDCEFCKKSFTSKSNLNLHRKTTKRCLKIQQEQTSKTEDPTYVCEHCDKEFLLKHHLDAHQKSCKKKKISTHEQLKKENELLKGKYEKQLIEIVKQLKKENDALKLRCEKYEKQNDELVNKLADKISSISNNAITTSGIVRTVDTDEFKNLP